jgi:hypothetical protein
MLAGAVLITFMFLLVFNAASMRYLADITPMFLLLSAAGVWWTSCRLKNHTLSRCILSALLVFLIGLGGCFSIFAGYAAH